MKTPSRSYHLLAGLCTAVLAVSAWPARAAVTVLPVAFHVDNSGAQSRHGTAAPSASRGAADVPDAQGQAAFLRVILPKEELTVGELVPVEIKAYFRAGVSASLNGLPMLSSDAFALNKLSDQPEQTRESINGAPYTVVTWTTSLSAVKAGGYPLNLDLPVMVRVKERGQRRGGGRNPFKDFFGDNSPFGDSPFDDSFFDDFFANATEKPLTLHTNGEVVKIKALPTRGRPADFSGAVGKFNITSDASTASGATGDPLKLKISVTGQGNFDRVSTPGLPASAGWKSYKPSAHFEPNGNETTAGTKTFEQSIIPLKAGPQDIPAIHFSYFDPDTQSYVTKTSAPIHVEIAPGVVVPPAAAVSAPATNAPQTDADGLAADEAMPARATSSLRPLVLTPWFIAANAAMLAALAVGAILRRLRLRRADDPERRQSALAEEAVNASLAAMDAALQKKDAPRFFHAARRALQERLAARWHVRASHVTLPEIRTRLNGHGEAVRAVFQTADELAYSGRCFTTPDLQQWRALVKDQLQELSQS